MSAGGRDGCEPQGCVEGLPVGPAQPRSPPRATGAHPRGAGPAARGPGSRRGRAAGGPVDREPEHLTCSSSQGECSQGLEGLLQGALSRGWARPPAGGPRATFPLFTRPPGPPLLSASISVAKSRSVAPVFTAHALQLHPAEGRGKGREEGGGEAGEHCRLSSLPPTSEAARRLWGAALEPSISCFTSSRPKCHFLRHVLWGPRGCGAGGPALKVLSQGGAVLARPAFSGTFCSK